MTADLDHNEAQRLKAATELRLKLVNKYLPDLKAVENTIDTDGQKGKITFSWEK